MLLLKRLTQSLSDVAAVAIGLMAALTVADIVAKNVFNHPIKGTFEIVELLLVFVVFLGLAEVFRSDSNICVDVADQMLGSRGTGVLKSIGAAASAVFLVLMGWAMIWPAWDTVTYPQWAQETGIPLYLYWLPILAGTLIAILAAAAVAFVRLRGHGDKGDAR